MNGLTIVLGFLFLILPVLVGFFIYSRPKEPEEPEEPGEPSIKLLESSAILNPGGIQSVIEGYTIEYSSGTYTDDELSKFVNIKVKWNNLGGFSQTKRLKLTLMNGETAIEPSKEFIRSSSSSVDSEYFENFSTAPLEYIFVGEDVSAGNFIGTIKPVFEYSMEITGSDTFKPLLLNNDINVTTLKKDVQLTLEKGIADVRYFYPILTKEDDSFVLESIFREPVTLVSKAHTLSRIIFKPVNKDQVQIVNADTNDRYVATNRFSDSLGPYSFGLMGNFIRDWKNIDPELDIINFNIKIDPGESHRHVIIKSGDKVLIVKARPQPRQGDDAYLMDMDDITDSAIWESMRWAVYE